MSCGCKDCLFFVNPYYPVMECIQNDKFISELKEEKTECKRFVKATKANADKWLKEHNVKRNKNLKL